MGFLKKKLCGPSINGKAQNMQQNSILCGTSWNYLFFFTKETREDDF